MRGTRGVVRAAGFVVPVWALISGVTFISAAARAETSPCGPSFSETGPDAEAYGAAQDYPVGTRFNFRRQSRLVGSYSHYDQIFPTKTIAAPSASSELQ